MACPDCPPNSPFPSECDQVVVAQVLIPGTSSPVPVWIQYQCGEPPGEDQLVFYADPDLTEEIEDFNVDNIISFGAGINGTSCADSTKVDLCPDTREAMHDMFVEQTTAINANIDAEIQAQTTAINANIDEVNLELDSIDDRLATANTTQANILSEVREYDSAGNPLPSTFSDAPVVFGYTGDNMTTMTVTIGTSTWVNTLTYNGSDQITGISGWVLQ